ncbi:protein S100-A1-like [Archocentrus centrarchus]|uniref:protein S100-A1-like n=1 Tax=Archocentrus centrarchus TaxID=63155 RepID=UPI0011EA3530|nr:protein S100-A1-like [Archocentrus centrarchus]
MTTKLQASICLLNDTFQTYAKEDGKQDTLSKSEVKKLLQQELPGLLSESKDQKVVDDLISGLDIDKDGEVDFIEFMILVASLSCAYRGQVPKKRE